MDAWGVRVELLALVMASSAGVEKVAEVGEERNVRLPSATTAQTLAALVEAGGQLSGDFERPSWVSENN